MSVYCEPPGSEIEGRSLSVEKASELWKFLSNRLHDFARPVSARRCPDGSETIIFEVDVAIPQIRRYPIDPIERVATVFPAKDDHTPETLALRDDFPLVPHVNPRATEFPRSLCIYEESYEELRLRWTSAAHVERVRAWLSDSAAGKLHRPDQPLEQIFVDSLIPLILPSDFPRDGSDGPLYISIRDRENKLPIFIGRRSPITNQRPALSIILTAPPQVSRHVRTVPSNFQSFHELLKDFEVDLIAELSRHLASTTIPNERMSSCVVIVNFPLLREPGGEVERYDTWAFAIPETVEKIGEALGLWEIKNGFLARLIGHRPSENALKHLTVILLNPSHLLSRNSAAEFNRVIPSERRILAIGVGALGSRVLLNCVRAGYGSWTVLDNDFMSPHNVTRHELTSDEVGFDKAPAMAFRANEIFIGAVPAQYSIDVLRPGEKKDVLDRLLAECEVICDMSASLAVGRFLAHDHPAFSRRVSIFLNPSGDSLIVLAEDSERIVRLDDLEMQYYRYLTVTHELRDHLRMPFGRIRYARSCRDISSVVSNEDVVVCAAFASRLLRQILEHPSAAAKIVRVTDNGVKQFDIALCPVMATTIGRWQMRIDERTLSSMRSHRKSRLQNETGGVLIGSVDFSRNLIYVADMLPSPADSEEYPTSYIRGVAGLRQKVEAIAQVTDGQLQYIGEWHSHPDGHSTLPSDDDRALFVWLIEHLAKDGMPSVMCIVGEHDERWLIEAIDQP